METSSTTAVILHVTYLYLLVLIMALLVERVLELLMAAYEFLEYKKNWRSYWLRRAKKVGARLEQKLRDCSSTQNINISGILYLMKEKLLGSKEGHSGEIPIISTKLVRHLVIQMASRFVASLLGCILCLLLNINLVTVFNMDLRIDFLDRLPFWLTLIVSGIIVGLGSEPVHNLIIAVEKRRKKKEAEMQSALSVRR